MDSLLLPATIESLEPFRSFVLQNAERLNLPQSIVPKLELVLEEILTNVFNHAYPSEKGDVELCCFLDGDEKFCLVINDWGIPFNPMERETPDLTADIDNRKVGGLGVYLVRKMADEINFERQGDKNILKFCLHIKDDKMATP